MLSPPAGAQPLVEAARRLFAECSDSTEKLVEQARASCVSWQHASDELFSFDPLDVELRAHAGATRGKLLAEPPKSGDYHRFGFDRAGELAVAERRSRFVTVECRLPDERNTLMVEVAPNGRHRLSSARLRVVQSEERWVVSSDGRENWAVRRYELDARGRIHRVEEATPMGQAAADIGYDESGAPTVITESGTSEVRWSRPRAGVAQMLAWYERALLAALEEPITYAAQHLHAVTAALVYSGGGGETLPPALCVATRAMVQAATPEIAFDPHNMIGDHRGDEVPELRLDDAALIAVGRQISFELGTETEPVRSLLQRVARKLSARRWTGSRSVVVYAADMDPGAWEADLRAVVSNAQLAALGVQRER